MNSPPLIIYIILTIIFVLLLIELVKRILRRFYCSNCYKFNTKKKIKENRDVRNIKAVLNKSQSPSIKEYYKCKNCGKITILYSSLPTDDSMY